MSASSQNNRAIRVFVSSTFRDMKEEREAMMSHTWPALRQFCREREVEFVEVDLRWGISEEQSMRNETLKLCLQEIRACRPYFVGLLGERYGWMPGPEAFTADLLEEEPWLNENRQASVTELELRHGALNHPDLASRALLYLRDPAYAQVRGADYLAEGIEVAGKQAALKALIRAAAVAKSITLRENYATPHQLATLVLEDLKTAINENYPKESVPDPLTREARSHEAFADVRRRTYIGRPNYFDKLSQHAMDHGGPLVLLGDPGSGKSALLANWVERWRKSHPSDLVIQHYIGSTPDSTDHARLMRRLIGEIKRWTNDPEEIPHTHDEVLKTFSVWLAKARSRAEQQNVRCILVFDALNQLEDRKHARLLGWLPSHAFTGPLRLLISTLAGETLHAVQHRGWATFMVEPLTTDERRRLVVAYLARYSKQLDAQRIGQLSAAPPTANPLYLKILLDELRVMGTHDQLDERVAYYLAAPEIPTLLQLILNRYQRDYERDQPGLVEETLSRIWAARRGLSETELLELFKQADKPQLPAAIWAPFRAALEELLVDHGGVLNFAHDYLRLAVETAYVQDEERADEVRLRLAEYFATQPIAARSSDELPWLFLKTKSFAKLRACLLDIDRFLILFQRDQEELRGYWVALGEERTMGPLYLSSFEQWAMKFDYEQDVLSLAANRVSLFFNAAALYRQAEPLVRRALATDEQNYGPNHAEVARDLNNLALLLHAMNRLTEAEPLYRRALAINEQSYGSDHPNVALHLNNLAELLRASNRLAEAEPLYRRALAINEQSYGSDHPEVARDLSNLAGLLQAMNRLTEAEILYRRAVTISERSYGPNYPKVALRINNLAVLLQATNRLTEAEPLLRRALAIIERSYGPDHPEVATGLVNLAELLRAMNQPTKAEPLLRRALAILEQSYGFDHPYVATGLNSLAVLLQATSRMAEAEPLYRRALAINEQSYGPDHPNVARVLNNLAELLKATNRLAEAEPLVLRALGINEQSYGADHPDVALNLSNLALLLHATNRLAEVEPLLRRALAIDEQSYGPYHPKVAIRLNNLAAFLRATNRLTEAEPLYRRALTIDEQSYVVDHPEMASHLNNLAVLLQATDRLAEAEPLLRRALAIIERSYGTDHPNVAIHLNNLADLLRATKQLTEAEALLRRALAISEQGYGPDHPNVAIHLNNIASLLQATNRLTGAEPLMRRAVTIFLKFGQINHQTHPHLPGTINNYVQLLIAMKRSPLDIVSLLNALGQPYNVSFSIQCSV